MKAPEAKPSKIEVEFKFEDRYYAYGVEFTIQGIQEEWLFEINERTEKKVFSRESNAAKVFDFGTLKLNADAKGFLNYLGQGTSAQKSFLSEYNDRNGKNLDSVKKAYTWFADVLRIIFPKSRFQGLSFKIEEDNKFRESFNSLLKYFNTGIVDIKRFPISKENVDIPREILDEIQSGLKPGNKSFVSSPDGDWYFFELSQEGVFKISKQKTIHEDENKKRYTFNMTEESDGSLRLLDFIPMLVSLKSGNSVFLIDEIDRSLHPMLSYEILNCYLSGLSEESDSQLIATTHESNLLNLELIRADEVWFVEKTLDGSSHLTSLAEYKPREDIRKGYLMGRYGAIPFCGGAVLLQM